MKNIELVVPKLEEYSYKEKLEKDPNTMSYNAGYNVKYSGYHYDTGCIDFNIDKWKDDYNYDKVAIISHGAAISNIKSKLSGEKYEDVDYCVIIHKNNKYRVIDYGTYN